MSSGRSEPAFEAVVIGGGFSGIGAAIKLDDAGFHNYVVLEEGDGVGGAWHWNTYPGIAVDIPSFSYQFSFEEAQRLVTRLRAGRGAEGLCRGLRRQVRTARADPAG